MASDGRKNGGSHEKSDPISVAIRRTAKRRGNQRVVAEKSMLGEVAAQGLILKWTAWKLNHEKWRVIARRD